MYLRKRVEELEKKYLEAKMEAAGAPPRQARHLQVRRASRQKGLSCEPPVLKSISWGSHSRPALQPAEVPVLSTRCFADLNMLEGCV